MQFIKKWLNFVKMKNASHNWGNLLLVPPFSNSDIGWYCRTKFLKMLNFVKTEVPKKTSAALIPADTARIQS